MTEELAHRAGAADGHVAADGWHDLAVANPTSLLERLGSECTDLQGPRELTVNASMRSRVLRAGAGGRVVSRGGGGSDGSAGRGGSDAHYGQLERLAAVHTGPLFNGVYCANGEAATGGRFESRRAVR